MYSSSAGRATAPNEHQLGCFPSQVLLEFVRAELARGSIGAAAVRILRPHLPVAEREPSDRVVVELRAENVGLDSETLQRVALFHGNGVFGENRPGIHLRRCVVNGHANLSLSGEDFPIPGRPASTVLGNSLFVDVERAVLRDGDHGVAEDPPSHDQPELRLQRADESKAGLAMDVGDVMYGDPGLIPQRFVALVARGPSRRSREDEDGHPLEQRRQPSPDLEHEPGPAFRAQPSEDAEGQGLPGSAVFVDNDAAQIEKRIPGEALVEDPAHRGERPSGEHDQAKSLRSSISAVAHGLPSPRWIPMARWHG